MTILIDRGYTWPTLIFSLWDLRLWGWRCLRVDKGLRGSCGSCRRPWYLFVVSWFFHIICGWLFCHMVERYSISWCLQVPHGQIHYHSWGERGQSYFRLSLKWGCSECSGIIIEDKCLLFVSLVYSQSGTVTPWLVIKIFIDLKKFGGLMWLSPLLPSPYGGILPLCVTRLSVLIICYALLWVQLLVMLVPL